MLTPKERAILEQKAAAKLELKRRQQERINKEFTIYGIVDMDRKLIRCWQDSVNGIREVSTDCTPTILVPVKLEKLVTTNKRYKVVVGGRGSGKSVTINKILTCKAKDHKIKVACFREFMNSIADSTYSSLKTEIETLNFDNFNITNSTIENEKTKSSFIFRGLARNIESIKSMDSIKIAFTDEAQTISDNSLKVLKPTIRTEGSELWFVGNPQSSADAFSKEFLMDYWDILERDGIYEDDLRLIIVANYYDNPFFPDTLEQDRLDDYEKLPRAIYDWIWLGKFNDTVDNAIIMKEWFDACIDAHKTPQFKNAMKLKGAKIASHDISDTGEDNKAYALRHGSIILEVSEKEDGDIADGSAWATSKAISDDADLFTFDASGMGVGIRKDVHEAFEELKIDIDEHRGGDRPDDYDLPYGGYDQFNKKKDKTNGEIFKNKRAQYIWRLRDRMYNTYRAIVKGEYVDPDECLSLSSEGIENMDALRSEVCRQPLKPNPNGLIQLMSKEDMKKLGIKSPNMLDALAMTMIYPNPKKKAREERRKKKLNYQDINMA